MLVSVLFIKANQLQLKINPHPSTIKMKNKLLPWFSLENAHSKYIYIFWYHLFHFIIMKILSHYNMQIKSQIHLSLGNFVILFWIDFMESDFNNLYLKKTFIISYVLQQFKKFVIVVNDIAIIIINKLIDISLWWFSFDPP